MSRIIVKNLPDKISKEKLEQIFGEKGVITDVQLKFTKTGKFRKFAFIGFQKPEYAQSAKELLDKSFINTSQIQIEICAELGDPNKPRAWSKYAPENILGKKKDSNELGDSNVKDEIIKSKKFEKLKIKHKVKELLKRHENDKLFSEFMEVTMPEFTSDLLFSTKEQMKAKKVENENEKEKNILANQNISDAEYLKLKTGQELNLNTNKEEVFMRNGKKIKSFELFTVKLSGLPFKIRKTEIKEFLSPAKPFTVRRALKLLGVAYCGFRTEKEMKLALLKTRSFYKGKRIFVTEVKKNKSCKGIKDQKWKKESDDLKNLSLVSESGRIFIRNLAYTVKEEELKELFEAYGLISELILPIDSFTRQPKGFAFVTFLIPEHATKAFSELDGSIFQGRMLHLLPALPNKTSPEDEDNSSFKAKKLKKEREMTDCSVNWNTFFIGENALAETIAATYTTSKENVLDDKNGGAAVRLALGESQVVNKMKDFLEENDVSLKAFENMSICSRSKTVILVKNLPFGTKCEELRERFCEFGELKRIVLPPGGVAALVEFVEASTAKKAFRRLSYAKFKHVPLYLEWAPKQIFSKETKLCSSQEHNLDNNQFKELKKTERVEGDKDVQNMEEHIPMEGTTIFVKNLNFRTNDEALRQHFSTCGTILSATISRRKDLHHPGKKLSMGYGFVKFSSKEYADKALKTLQFSTLDDHKIELKRSDRTSAPDTITDHRNKSKSCEKPSAKILVRNVPFQATQKEIVELFKVFGEIKSTRLPKKMVGTGSHRGFCFVEYNTIHDAKRAFSALCQSTHLYGRRLALEWAAADDDVETLRAKTAQQFKGETTRSTEKKKNINMDDLPSSEE